MQTNIEKDLNYPEDVNYCKKTFNEQAMKRDRTPNSWTPMKYIKSQEDTIYLIKW